MCGRSRLVPPVSAKMLPLLVWSAALPKDYSASAKLPSAPVVRQHRHRSAQQILQALCEAARSFAQNTPQLDDITALVIKVL